MALIEKENMNNEIKWIDYDKFVNYFDTVKLIPKSFENNTIDNLISNLNEEILLNNNIIISNKFKGIKNMGNTCYMNCILQCLFHINEFRDAIFKINIPKRIKNVVNALNNLFKELLINNNQQYINPESFFNLYDGDNLKMNIQRDAEEFFLELLDKLEISLKHTNHENLNKYFFQGSIISKFISIEFLI